MVWSVIKKSLAISPFVIDEAPEPVLETLVQKGMVAPPQTAETAVEALLGTPQRADIMSQIAFLMIEQVRLSEKAKLLERNQSGEDEFGRFVRQVLPFLDNFARLLEMAREYPPSDELNNWLKSIEALYFRLTNLFETYGLRFVNALGKPVDLNFQEVIEYRATEEHPHNTVIREIQKGVVFRDRLVRDAKVVVACNQ